MDEFTAIIKYKKSPTGKYSREITTALGYGGASHSSSVIPQLIEDELRMAKEEGRQEIIDNIFQAITKFAKGK